MPNRFVPLGKGADFDQAVAVINANFAQLDNEAVTKVFKQAAGNAVIQGKLPGDTGHGILLYAPDGKVAIACYINASGQPVFKIAKEGFDALTATDDQLILNSAQNTFKIVDVVDIGHSLTTAGAGDFESTPLAHGQTFTPGYIAFIEIDPDIAAFAASSSTNLANPAITWALVGGAIELVSLTTVSVDSTNVILTTQLSNIPTAGSYDFSARVYLLQETFS